MRLNAKQIMNYTGGSYVVEPMDARLLATGITWDSREVQPGDVYVALPGERVDGHSFVNASLVAGAIVILVMTPPSSKTCQLAKEMGACIIEVANTFSAITDLARAWRSFITGTVIGITGSTGKTTVKNLVRDVLSAKGSTVATKANQNNELGVPRTLLAADPDTQFVVVEMGMRGRGQIAELCEFVKPTFGLVVNVNECHIELLGSRENIARAKAELFEALPASTGRAFVNYADDFAQFVCEQAKLQERAIHRCFFGAMEEPAAVECAVWASNVSLDDQGQPCFTLHAKGFGHEALADAPSCTLHLRGLHNVSNATAAAAVGLSCGLTLSQVAQALADAEPEGGRQEIIRTNAGVTVVNDAYNANPESMRASLKTFCAMKTGGKHVAVLGDMAELGDYAQACHEGIGRLAATLDLDVLICVGELSAYIANAAQQAGMAGDTIVRAQSVAEVFGVLDDILEPNDAVLVKASHCTGLARVVEGLIR